METPTAVWLRLKESIEELYKRLAPTLYFLEKTMSNVPVPIPGNLLDTPVIYPKAEEIVLEAAKKATSPYDVQLKIDPKRGLVEGIPDNPAITDTIIKQVQITSYNEFFEAEEGIHPEVLKDFEDEIKYSGCFSS